MSHDRGTGAEPVGCTEVRAAHIEPILVQPLSESLTFIQELSL